MIKSQVCYLLLVLGLHDAAKNDADTKIHFPGRANFDLSLDAGAASNCPSGFCTEYPNYPKEQVEKLLAKHPEYQNRLEALDIGTRAQIDSGGDAAESICESTTNFYAYEAAKNQDDVLRLLVQTDARKQYVYTDSCRSVGSACKFKSSFPLNVDVKCEQKFMKQRLLVAGDNGTLFLDVFTVPCCCVCSIYNKA